MYKDHVLWLEPKRKDGRYEARYIESRDESGKAVYRAVYGKSKAEVREKVKNAKREMIGNPPGLI